jgi:hypothetical protein
MPTSADLMSPFDRIKAIRAIDIAPQCERPAPSPRLMMWPLVSCLDTEAEALVAALECAP